MRALIFPAVAAAFLATSPLAFATEATTGIVTALNPSMHTVTLDNRTIFALPANFKDPGLKIGEKVRVSWNKRHERHIATGVVIERS